MRRFFVFALLAALAGPLQAGPLGRIPSGSVSRWGNVQARTVFLAELDLHLNALKKLTLTPAAVQAYAQEHLVPAAGDPVQTAARQTILKTLDDRRVAVRVHVDAASRLRLNQIDALLGDVGGRLARVQTLPLDSGWDAVLALKEDLGKIFSGELPRYLPVVDPDADPKGALEEAVKANEFIVHRGLKLYKARFGADFQRDVSRLGHWLDGGAGDGLALQEFAEQDASAARLTGVAYAKPVPLPDGRVKFLWGRFFEDIPPAEIGQADLITDLYGVFTYTTRLDEALALYLRLMKPGAALYIFGPDHSGEVRRRDGSWTKLSDWVMAIPGLLAERQNDGLVLKVRRRPGETSLVPRLKPLSQIEDGSPPWRRFEEDEGGLAVEPR